VTTPHPAKFTDTVIAEIDKRLFDHLERGDTILDPFAGTGRIHRLDHRYTTFGLEIEPDWAKQHPRTIQGDALALPFIDRSFDAVVTSPTYGNRLADTYDGRDGSRRHTYRIDLGRLPHAGSSATLQWGDAYREFHVQAWKEATRVARKLVMINVSNHIRAGKEQPVVEFHTITLMEMGWLLCGAWPVSTPRMRHGQNHKARVDSEFVLAFRPPC
jgi:hypothetical protein